MIGEFNMSTIFDTTIENMITELSLDAPQCVVKNTYPYAKKKIPKRIVVDVAPERFDLSEPVVAKAPPRAIARSVHVSFVDCVYEFREEFVDAIYGAIRVKQRQFALGSAKRAGSKFTRLFMSSRLPRFSLFWQGKLLADRHVSLQEYGVPNHATLQIEFHLTVGGAQSQILLPTYSHVQMCEKQVLSEVYAFSVQSAEDEGLPQMGEFLRSCFGTSENGQYVTKLIEDVFVLVHGLVRSKTRSDYTVALITFVKLRLDGPLFSSKHLHLLTTKLHDIFDEFAVQSVEETFTSLRDYLSYYERVRDSPVFAKLYKFSMYALSLSLFERLGVTFESCRYTQIEAEAIKRKFHMGPDFIHTLLDTMLFLCERGYQCMVTGSLDPIYHCGTSYQKWFDDAMKLKRIAHQLSFPEAHGIDRHKYLADLRDHIEKGEAIYKHAVRLTNYDKKCVGGILGDLKLLLDNEITKREAQKERDAPFSVLLYGGSSIGKSSLTAMLFNYYGKLFDLQTGSEYKYTRNANDEFWSGFNSSQWCVQLDDIAFMHPDKASDGDKSVMEMLQVVNNVPFVPAQADLADKGRTPMRAKLVIATTNCMDLNAYHYFQTPLAVRRRLPFVIHATVKKEYGRVDAPHMLDNSKTENVDGEFCNYWDFRVLKVIPDPSDNLNRRAITEEIAIFHDVNDFLVWFAKAAHEHRRSQQIVRESGEMMRDIEICKECYRNVKQCQCVEVQSGDEPEVDDGPPTYWECCKYYLCICIVIFLNSDIFTLVMRKSFQGVWFEHWLQRKLIAPEARMKFIRAHFRKMGDTVQRSIGGYILIMGIISILVHGYMGYKASKWLTGMLAPPPLEPQGNISAGIGQAPQPREDERQNVWHKDDFELTSFDTSSVTTSMNSLDHEQVCEMVAKNCVHLSSMCASRTTPKVIRATCLGGHIYVCNNHGLPLDETLTVTVQARRHDTGVTPNMEVTISQHDIYRKPERDLAFVQIRNIPPRKNISGLLPLSPLGGIFKGTYVGITKEGQQFRRSVAAIKSQMFNVHSCGVDVDTKGWLGTVDTPTQNGDCGSMLVAQCPRGPVLLGLHFVGEPVSKRVGMMPLIVYDFEEAVEYFDRPIVESHEPTLSAPSASHVLGDLHTKSVFRYLEEGTANVYGSFQGWRAVPRSRVVPTVMAEAVVRRGYTVRHGKPVMKGWEPWRIAAQEMVSPVSKIDSEILDKCVDGYVNDVLSVLPQEELDEIMVYDDVTTLNGAAGVAYVDKMNRNTSAGFPWRKTKKAFLEPLDDGTDGVKATPEIMERVQKVIEGYQQGRRYMPVFTGHLKDEALKFSKIESKKTRVFTGAPFDWSFVVRKYLLSFVRVMQRNKFIFEAAPGTNAQSLEWQEIRSYLVQHGLDRMIAGDYAFFDKSMPPIIILAAFAIMRRICAKAGYTLEDLLVLEGIAEDTAFPLVDFNGDLVEFFGSNPSGHPLTVIVNCLANSLYMRYCWMVLSGDKDCSRFKAHVALITYGDDNALGVSRLASFFNHTTIQSALASIGITYTMADKEAASVPYISIDEVSFLKRTWRLDNDVGAYLAPLEEASIAKSLTRVVASKTVPPEKQATDILSAACREYFFYGKEVFHEKRQMLMEIADECALGAYVEESTFPTWIELKDNFWRNSQHVLQL